MKLIVPMHSGAEWLFDTRIRAGSRESRLRVSFVSCTGLAQLRGSRAWLSRQPAVVVAAIVMLFAGGCAHPPPTPPFLAPAAHLDVKYHSASPTSVAVPATDAQEDPTSALAVHLRLVAIENPPGLTGDPVETHARLILQTRSGLPVLPVARLTKSVTYFPPDRAPAFAAALGKGTLGRTAVIADLHDALPRGISVEFEVKDATASQDPLLGQPVFRRIGITLRRADREPEIAKGNEQAELALTIADFGPDRPASSSAESDSHSNPTPPPTVFQKETVLLEPVSAGAPREVALAIPFQFTGHPGWGVAAVLEMGPGTDNPAFQSVLDHAYAEARASSSIAGAPATLPSEEEPTLRAAIDELSQPEKQLQALVFLSDQTDARLCMEFTLAADPALRSRLSAKIAKEAASTPMNAAAVGWMLDRQTLTFLAEVSAGGKLPPELVSLLTLYTGEAGRHDASLEEVCRGLKSRADLQSRLIAENQIFLEDSSPASRVRAFDWLNARGHAPPSYDPLGPARQRREALDNAMNTGSAGGTP